MVKIPPRLVLWLTLAAIGLPMAVCVVQGFALVTDAAGDSPGALILRRTALALAVVWTMALLALVLTLAWKQLEHSEEHDS